jgi:hypothetical protein
MLLVHVDIYNGKYSGYCELGMQLQPMLSQQSLIYMLQRVTSLVNQSVGFIGH